MPATRASRAGAAGKTDGASASAKRRERRPRDSDSKRAKQGATGDAAERASADVPKTQRARRGEFPPRENGAVGLPNRSGSDCFWLSTLQCIRHAPGYVDSLRQCTAGATGHPEPESQANSKSRPGSRKPSAMDLLSSTTQLMNEMDGTNELEALAARSPALERFRECCSESLSVPLVEMRMRHQSQQDVHEFLLQLVEALSRSPDDEAADVGAASSSRPLTRKSARQGEGSIRRAAVAEQPGYTVTDQLRIDVAQAYASSDTEAAEALLQPLRAARTHGPNRRSDQQCKLAGVNTMSMLQHYFMGMRCATMHCSNCGAHGGTRPAAFITEEVGLAAAAQRLRMERAQALNIQFEKDEVIHCPRCKQLMRAPCEAAALRCASCRAVINPHDCAEQRQHKHPQGQELQQQQRGPEEQREQQDQEQHTNQQKGLDDVDKTTRGAGNGHTANNAASNNKRPTSGGKLKRSNSDPPLQTLDLQPLLTNARDGEVLDGYKCDSCSQTGTTHRRDLIFLLPQVYIVHINRAGIGGEIGGEGYIRHANPVSFPDTLDLRDCGLLLNPDAPLDWNLEPCSTEYDLFGACFHRGTSARCGHYVAVAKLQGTDDGNGNELWVELNDAAAAIVDPPMTAERAIDNKKAVLLWYSRRPVQ